MSKMTSILKKGINRSRKHVESCWEMQFNCILLFILSSIMHITFVYFPTCELFRHINVWSTPVDVVIDLYH